YSERAGGTLQYTAMLFVLPQTRSAVALVCSGHIDPIATTLPIIDALLQEIGPFSVHTKKKMVATKTAEPLLPGMEGYGGYYASDSAICKIDIDSKSSTMTISTHDGSAFIPTATSRHVGNGLFQSPDGTFSPFKPCKDRLPFWK
ncbi:MAG: hypothetical protein LRY50_16865, partial [Geovibrio sp.]|nr:hypothetical protein [Geovibrio sp.]